jgi:hypothetical protein
MKIRVSVLTVGMLLAVATLAQQSEKRIVAEGGGPDDRASARVLYWNQKTDSAAGQFAIDYGRPVWKKAYEDPAQFDKMTNGKVWRLGSNFWTTLSTDLPLKISGQNVPVGVYYLGLQRSADGAQWSLAFIDPAGATKQHLDAFDIQKAKVEFGAPMSADKAESTVDKLTITFSYPHDDFRNVTLKVAWGNLALSAPVRVALGE